MADEVALCAQCVHTWNSSDSTDSLISWKIINQLSLYKRFDRMHALIGRKCVIDMLQIEIVRIFWLAKMWLHLYLRCFYCKKMAPVYEDLAKDEQEAHPSLRLIKVRFYEPFATKRPERIISRHHYYMWMLFCFFKVDCSSTNPKTKRICARNDISFLPTLKVFEHGRFVKEYEGDKTKKGWLV